MTRMQENAAYDAIFRKYWRRWLAIKYVDLLVMLVVAAAYAILMLAAVGYDIVPARHAAAIPFALVVVFGIGFLTGRPWSFTGYLDRVIERRRQRDAVIAQQYLAQQDVLASFGKLEAEMRRRNPAVRAAGNPRQDRGNPPLNWDETSLVVQTNRLNP